MNDRYDLNGEMIRVWLGDRDLKRTHISRMLNVSDNLVDKMLAGHIPKERTLKALAHLMGIPESDLLIPRETARVG